MGGILQSFHVERERKVYIYIRCRIGLAAEKFARQSLRSGKERESMAVT